MNLETLPEMTAATHTCIACDRRQPATPFVATERLLDSREEFAYWECSACGCVQIEQVPEDLARHYPERYFAYRPQHRLAANRLRRLLDPLRLKAARGRGSSVGALANRLLKPLNYADWCRIADLDGNARVLDVGCGTGKLLVRLRHAGFARCLGVDPFIPQSLHYVNGVSILKQDIGHFAASSEERFDLVMFHHSLEHTPHPLESLAAAREVLAPGGWILVRVPVAGSQAWRTYRENWMALDPPRHLFLPTERSMRELARRGELRVEQVAYDSTFQQFALSEMYRRKVSPTSPAGRAVRFDATQIKRWQEQAEALNAAGDGDQAAFFLRRA